MSGTLRKNLPSRDGYGHGLLELMEQDASVLVLDADLSRSTRTEWISQRYPNRFFNCGIAEQNMIGIAVGLAFCGFIPFATTYAIFIGRAYDQIRQAVGFAGTNVKIVATHAGLAAGLDGGSHQGIEDVALMRLIPGMVILSPCDYDETKLAVGAAARHDGPVYLRLQKEAMPRISDPQQPFEIGKASTLRSGRDVSLLATGSLVAEALTAAGILQERGIQATVVNISTVKPLDVALLSSVLQLTRCGVVAEEHSICGGLYEAILSLAAAQGLAGHAILPVAIKDTFGQTGTWPQLKEHYGLTSGFIVRAAEDAIRRRT